MSYLVHRSELMQLLRKDDKELIKLEIIIPVKLFSLFCNYRRAGVVKVINY